MLSIKNRVEALGKYALLNLRGQYSNVMNDYDNVADTYDDFYAYSLGRASTRFLAAVTAELPARSDAQLIELAAGTGEVTKHLIKLGQAEQADLAVVDQSAKMLQANIAKNGGITAGTGPRLSFVNADAVEYLRELPDRSVDAVLCAWGVCYLEHKQLQAELTRILRPGGYVGIIENRKGTLHELERMFTYVLMEHPKLMKSAISINLPKDAAYIERSVLPASATSLTAVDDSAAHTFDDTDALMDYIVKSGVAAGYLDAIDEAGRSEFIKLLTAEVDRRGARTLPVVHRYSITTARV